MAKEPRLAKALGVDKATLEAAFRQRTLEAAEVVAAEFRRALTSLNADSINNVFQGYEVVIETEPYTLSRPKLGKLHVIRAHIYIKSPYPDLNVFDILDSGRKELPVSAPGQSPYPLWSITPERTVEAPGGQPRRAPSGRFARSRRPSRVSGTRPEKLRFKLVGTRPANAQYSPSVFTMGPIAAIPPFKLYERIYNEAKKDLRRGGFKDFELLLVKAKGV